MDRWWRRYLLVVAALVATWVLLPSALGQDIAAAAIGLVVVAAMVLGTRRWQSRNRAAWYLLALGQLLLVTGDGIYSWYQDVQHVSPFPSLADVAYLSAYPVLAVGLHLLFVHQRTVRDLGSWIDAFVVTIGGSVVVWMAVVVPTLAAEGPTFPALLSLAYPAGDLVLLVISSVLFITSASRPRAYVLLVGSLGALIAADAVYAVLGFGPSTVDRWLDATWLASYVLAGAAALHKTANLVAQPNRQRAPMTWWRWAGLTAAALVVPGVEATGLLLGFDWTTWPLIVAFVALIGLVLTRLQLAVRDAERAYRARLDVQQRLAHQAAHDELTGAASRSRTLELLDEALGGGAAGRPVGLLYVDLDHFKQVNDTFGHIVGDEVLRQVTRRIRSAVRPSDVVGRVGGDEIVVLVFEPASEPDLVDIASRIVAVVGGPLNVEGHELSISVSVGVALSRDGVVDADELVREADAAAYRAKFDGRARVQVFGDALRAEVQERAALEAAIRAGLAAGEFVMYYQPLVEMDSSRVVGYEALARWERPGHGLVHPMDFIPVAERTALICDIGRWGLTTATRQIALWEAEGRAPVTVAVNISGRYLASGAIVDDVVDALLESGVAAERLVLEVTETVRMDSPVVAAHLRSLNQVGVHIHIDDFGTGYTSIGQLKHLPASALKLDRSLTAFDTVGSREMVELAVHAAHAVGLQVIAEGVETAAQLETLRQLGCDLAQGFYLAVPMPANQVEASTSVGDELARPAGDAGEPRADAVLQPVAVPASFDPS